MTLANAISSLTDDNVTIGCDPELFIADGGKIISANGLTVGTKEHPEQCKYGAVQLDNVLLEFNTDPVRTEDDFVAVVNKMLGFCRNRAGKRSVALKASHRYSTDELNKFGPAVFEFGCDAEYDAKDMSKIEAPDANSTLRTASGHVHIGFTGEITEPEIQKTVLLCDYLLGLPSLLYDVDTERRTMYGKAGAHRPKEYGVEYRTLSNFWLQDNTLIRWVFRNAKEAYLRRGDLMELHKLFPVRDVANAINNHDRKYARKVVSALDINLPDYGSKA